MGYPAKLLAQGESIAFEMRPHWRSMIVPSIVLVGTVAIGGYLYGLVPSDGVASYLHWVILAVALLVLILWFVRPLLVWLTTQYVFTDRRIITRTGIVARHGMDMPLSKVNDVSFDYSIFERLIGTGTLIVSSASETGDLVIDNIPRVEEVQREIYRLSEEDQRRRGGPNHD